MNKTINIKKIVFIFIIVVVAVISLLLSLNTIVGDKYYQTYAKENKTIGEINHYTTENEHFLISIFHPTVEYDVVNQYIENYYNQCIVAQTPSENKEVLYMDYEINEVGNQYISVKLNFVRYDKDNKIIYENTDYSTYNKKTNAYLNIDNTFRGEYKQYLQSKNIDISQDSTQFILEEDCIQFKNEQMVLYSDIVNYIELDNKIINPKAPEIDVINQQTQIDPSKPMIALTFDDGPSSKNTLRLATEIEKYNGRCTFFILGDNAKKHPEIVKSLYQQGHEIANHSMTHKNFNKIDENIVKYEINETQELLYTITGKEPKQLRPPYGVSNDIVRGIAGNNNLRVTNWTIDTQDWKYRDSEFVKNEIINNAYNGGVVLIHDIHSTSVDGVINALPILYNQGYQFVTLDTLLQYHEPHIDW